MQTVPAGFTRSHDPEPHAARTQAIAKAHPEIRQLNGKNALTFFPIAGLVAIQLTAAYLIVGQPWWVFLLVAYTVGAVANHALLAMIHESAHNLIFKRQIFNILTAIFANIPGTIPYAMSFKKFHLIHHWNQGDYHMDADIPSTWEADWVGNSPLRKAFWLLFFPLFSIGRSMRVKDVRQFDRWVVLNWVLTMGTNALVWFTMGPIAFLYLVVSFFFSAGLHPVGARWIQRHYLIDEGSDQETFSYYGFMNRFAFNVGYHNEHHDFPRIPWNKLPQLRAAAPEFYEDLLSHQSWARLFVKFLFDRNLTLYSRMVRDPEEIAMARATEEAADPTSELVGAGNS